MKKLLKNAFACGSLVLWANSSFAWGPLGHHTIGAVADGLLNDQAKAQVASILANDLDSTGRTSGRTSLQQVASWADEIRSTPADRPNWHYDDAPACKNFDSSRAYCENGECATQKIEDLSKVLKDKNAGERGRNEALKWIVHLVGDIHQPLHATTNVYTPGVTDNSGQSTDRGGNDVPVALSGIKTKGAVKLHSAWDTVLVSVALGEDSLYPSQATVNNLIVDAKKISPSQTGGSVVSWAAESHEIADNTAYKFSGFACNQPQNDYVVLDSQYVSNASKKVQERLVLAVVRLANLLNELLGN